jgi:hypothetical protein
VSLSSGDDAESFSTRAAQTAMQHEIRAAMSRFLRRQVERMPAAARSDVLQRVSRRSLDRIDGTLAIAWLPMEAHMDLCNAIQDVVGGEENVALWRETALDLCQRPLLKGLVNMSVRLFGATPHAVTRVIPTAYASQTRRLGTVGVQERDTFVVAELRNFPADRFRFSCYVEGLHGSLAGVMSALFPRRNLPVTLEKADEACGFARYRVSMDELAT